MELHGEGGGIEKMLQWPKELLHQPVEERRKKKAWRHREDGKVHCEAGEEGDDKREGGHRPRQEHGWEGGTLSLCVDSRAWEGAGPQC
jgi:hypothetical protein